MEKKGKGFAFSLDAAAAIFILAGGLFMLVGIQAQNSLSSSQTSTIAEDTLYALDASGYIVHTIDTNSPTQAAQLLREQLLLRLPAGFDANVTMSAFTAIGPQCASQKTFGACFPDANRTLGSDGAAAGNDAFVSGRKFYLRKQPPGDCNLSFASFGEIGEKALKYILPENLADAMLSEAQFAVDVNVSFDVNVTPGTAIACDQNVAVKLTVSVPEDVRKPIDLMLVMDRSGSMSWGGIASTSNPSGGPFVDGSYAYFADGSAGVRSILISNPLAPTLLDREDPGTVIDVHGNYSSAYVFVADTSGQDQLFAINRGNPASMSQTGSINFDSIAKIFVQGGYVYAAGEGSNRSDSGLVIINATNPAGMSLAGTADTSGPLAVFVDSNNYAYIADGASGLRIINVTAKSLGMPITGTYNTPGSAMDVVTVGNYAYVADGSNGLVIVNTSNKASPTLAGTYNTPGTAYAVKVVGNYAFVADNSSLQIINVSNPASPALYKSYATTYLYRDIDVAGNYAYLTAAVLGVVTMDWTVGPRIDNAKAAASSFVDFNGWKLPPDQMGLVSFNSSATLDQALTTDKSAVKADINALVANGGTNIASGIDSATAELNSVRHNPNALKFQVVLSDGESTSGDSQAAAQSAAASKIIIYAIGVGEASPAELTAIAAATGGEYFAASDTNSLQNVFGLIALKVAELANDANVSVPIFSGSAVMDDGNGTIQGGNIVFNAGDINKNNPFTATYTLNFPCKNANVCNASAFTFPGPGAKFTYFDSNGLVHSVDFNASATIPFRTRDLNVGITSGEVIGKDSISLNTKVRNIGGLDANSTTLRFRLNDTNGQVLASYNVPALCSPETLGCTGFVADYGGVNLGKEGVIYATINDDNSLSECPVGNYFGVNCYGGPSTQVYAVEYYVWRS